VNTTNGQPVIEAFGLGKVIRGKTILEDVNLSVRAGEVLGFVGPNGAGKTTLIRLLAGLAQASAGEVRIEGKVVDGRGPGPESLGLLVEGPGFVEHLSGRRNLLMLARLRGVIGAEEVDAAMRQFDLDPDNGRAVSKYSLGMRQRLGLAQALMERPRILILDEPTNGLDVVGITKLRESIADEAARGAAVFLASHLLQEVEIVCDRVLMVQDGRVVDEIATAKHDQLGDGVRVRVSSPEHWERIASTFVAALLPEDQGDGAVGLIKPSGSVPELVRSLVALGVDIEEVAVHRTSLEDAFFSRIGRGS
jgi:ABC-2 type transport system ATP-binding protein